ncbi:MAG: radical SAM protein [Candidatus Aminicenantaceae bacterium]
MNERVTLIYPAQKKLFKGKYNYILRGEDISFLLRQFRQNKDHYQIVGFDFYGNLKSKAWNKYLEEMPEEFMLMLHPEKKEEYSEIMGSLSERKTEIIIESAEKNFEKNVKVWSSLNFQVKIIMNHLQDDMISIYKELLEYYVHTPLLRKRIFPFHFLMENILHSKDSTLLDYYLGLKSRWYFVTDDLKVRSVFPHEVLPSFGILSPTPKKFEEKAKNFAREYYEKIASQELPCLSCAHFNLCGGFILLISRDKTCAWPSFFDTLEEEMALAKEHFAQLKEEKEREEAGMDSTLFVSQECVNNCVFCAVADKRKKQIPDFYQKVEKALDRITEKKIRMISFSGSGEPTLNPHLPGLIEKARKRGVKQVSVFTNGYRMTEEKMKRLVEKGLTGFLLSVHGLENSHDLSVRRKGSFNDILNFLKIWKKFSPSVHLHMNTCFTLYNLDILNELAEFSSKNSVKLHSVVYPEWSGNVLSDPENIPKYSLISQTLKSFKFNLYPHVFFDNIPHCFVPDGVHLNFIKQKDMLLYDDLNIYRELPKDASIIYNTFLDICRKIGCRHLSSCCGFDKNYLAYHGEKDLVRIIKKRFSVKGSQ